MAIEKSIRIQIKAHPETCDLSLRAQTSDRGRERPLRLHRNTEVLDAQVIGLGCGWGLMLCDSYAAMRS